ncbi:MULTISPECIES: DHH family phosphoesterase [Enterococcus]|uniref:DHH family phosphoesterase n=1 Tax=Enterococcus TaxID=1350 RepID=UPI0010F4CBAC|nr:MULTISPECIES: DHH family phosphoesterase [Enterococcus]KAF1302635.1 phosphoesterase [Enterococcus sp. JM9B]
MKKEVFGKLALLCCLLQVLSLLFLNKWLAVGIVIVANLFLFQMHIRLRRWHQISEQESIRMSARVAQENSKYLSEKSPSLIFIYDEHQQVEWMNQNALQLLHKYSKSVWQDYLVNLLNHNKEQGLLHLPDDVYTYSMDRKKGILFLYNVTDQERAKKKQLAIRPGIGIISVDNYTDVVDKMDDKEVSYLNSLITTVISDWINEYQIFYKRLNAERYFFVAHNEDIDKMAQDEFSLMERIRKATEEQAPPLTISIGVAYGSESLVKIGEVAQNNLDMALVRGGDQTVLKEALDEAKPKFFGGNTAGTAKRTRVRSRAMSTALKNIINENNDIYIMGHRFPDMDAIGSAFGVACLADFQGKTNYIVIDENELIPDVERCLEEIHKHEELEAKLITVQQAMGQITKDSLLIMVDYHKPSLSISQPLYEQFEKVVIIDHHRRGDEFPSKPLLTYIESSASSASELVSELIQYESNSQKKLDKITATLLLSGMIVDTKSFAVRTSSRTFDVASYLKDSGADGAIVQYMLSTDLTSFLEISEMVASSEFITTSIVVACGSEEKLYDSVTAAKTADTLLSMNGVEAAFVITKREDGKVGISARSSGKVNVQKLMETLGGGGHFTNAATQISGKKINEVKTMLYNELKEYQVKEGTTE